MGITQGVENVVKLSKLGKTINIVWEPKIAQHRKLHRGEACHQAVLIHSDIFMLFPLFLALPCFHGLNFQLQSFKATERVLTRSDDFMFHWRWHWTVELKLYTPAHSTETTGRNSQRQPVKKKPAFRLFGSTVKIFVKNSHDHHNVTRQWLDFAATKRLSFTWAGLAWITRPTCLSSYCGFKTSVK